MRRVGIIFFLILLSFACRANSYDRTTLSNAMEQIIATDLDTLGTYYINDFELSHRDLTFKLDSGRIAFAKPLVLDSDTINYFAYFEGIGSYHFFPSDKQAKEQLDYHFESTEIRDTLYRAMLVFSQEIYRQIQAKIHPCPESFWWRQYDRARDSWRRLVKDEEYHFVFQILRSIVEPADEPFLLTNFQQHGWSLSDYYYYDPYFVEEVCFMRSEIKGPMFAQYLKRLCSYSCISTGSGSKCRVLNNPQITMDNYGITVDLDQNGFANCAARVECSVIDGPAQLLNIVLHENIHIDSIVSNGDLPPEYFRYTKDGNKSQELYLIMERPRQTGEKFVLTFYYQGQIAGRVGREYTSVTGISWYPMYAEPNPATFRIDFEMPYFKDLALKIDGATETHSVNDGNIKYHFTMTNPGYPYFEFIDE